MSASISYSYMPGRAAHRLAVRVARDRDRLAHVRELGGLLAEPHLVQEVARLADGGGPVAGARLHLLRAADEGHEPLRERVVPPDRVPGLRRLLEEARQLPL